MVSSLSAAGATERKHAQANATPDEAASSPDGCDLRKVSNRKARLSRGGLFVFWGPRQRSLLGPCNPLGIPLPDIVLVEEVAELLWLLEVQHDERKSVDPGRKPGGHVKSTKDRQIRSSFHNFIALGRARLSIAVGAFEIATPSVMRLNSITFAGCLQCSAVITASISRSMASRDSRLT